LKLLRKFASFQSVKISYLDNESEGDCIFVTHANGYSGSCYLYLYRYFGDKFRWIFLDFSGHGSSESSLEFKNWNYFADQILFVVQKENLTNPIGIGHSLGAASLSLAAIKEAKLFKALLLLDPTVLSNTTLILAMIFGNKLALDAKKRRNEFSNTNQIKKVFKRFPMFSKWEESIFDDYVNSCFHPVGKGLQLACPPEVESKIFNAIPLFFPNKFKNLGVETKIVIPKNSDVCSYSAAKKLIGNFPSSDITILEDQNHFFPFENPEIVINQLKRLIYE
jgi:pimeloyl-ACP methyl ester carboxylesterase